MLKNLTIEKTLENSGVSKIYQVLLNLKELILLILGKIIK